MAGFGFSAEAITDLGNADTPDQMPPSGERKPIFKPENMPMGRIMAAVMRSAAKVQGQEQAKKVAADQATANARMSVTMQPNPAGGPPLVTVKNAPADLLNGTQQADAQQAYNQPKEQVEKKLNEQPTTDPPPQKPPDNHPLEQAAAALEANGIPVVRPWDPAIRASLDSEAGLIDMAKNLGIPNAEKNAKDAFARIKSGKLSKDAAARNLAKIAATRLESASHDLQSTLEPYQQADYRKSLERDRTEDNARLSQAQKDAEAAKVAQAKKDYRDKTNFARFPEDEAAFASAVRASSDVEWSQADISRLRIKQQQDIGSDFTDFIGNREKYALGDYPTWEAAKTAFGHAVTAAQDKQGYAAWDAAHKYSLRKANEAESAAQLREARLERLYAQITSAGTEKPVPIGRQDLSLMPASELVKADPSKVKNYDSLLEQKEGMLSKTMRDAQDRAAKAVLVQNAINSTPKEQRRFGWQVDLAHVTADIQDANRDFARAQEELKAVQGKRAERQVGAPKEPPAPVANGRYSREVESSIAAYMREAKVGRAKAIAALRAAGRLK